MHGISGTLPGGLLHEARVALLVQQIEDLFDSLRIIAAGDQGGIVGVDDDAVFHSQRGHQMLIAGADDAVFSVQCTNEPVQCVAVFVAS